jgi:outer membrane protein OmpA-like peptidoglycan-associated protein
LQRITKKPVRIVIKGHTDSSGTETLNLKLSKRRAEKIVRYYTDLGIKPAFFTAAGVGNNEPLKKEQDDVDREYNRAVSFEPFYLFSEKGRQP